MGLDEPKTVRLIDNNKTLIAIARVTDEGQHYGGTIDLSSTPADACSLFNEWEDLVNDQVLSLLDEVQTKIALLSIKAVFDDGREFAIEDLQVYPATGEVSFKLAGSPALAQKSA